MWSSCWQFCSYKYEYLSVAGVSTTSSRSTSPDSEAKIARGSTKANSLKSPEVMILESGAVDKRFVVKFCLLLVLSGLYGWIGRVSAYGNDSSLLDSLLDASVYGRSGVAYEGRGTPFAC